MPVFRKLLFVLTVVGLTACAAPPADVPSGPQITADVIYGHKLGMALTLDVYGPEEPNGAGILLLNSASWVSPSCAFRVHGPDGHELDPTACTSINPSAMLEQGFTVFDVRHGSAPRFDVSEATADALQALSFVRDNASTFGVDSSRLGVWGASAGGQLALMLALASTGDSPPVRSAVVYMAPHSVEVTDPAMLELVPALNMPAQTQREVSPIYYVTPDAPPTLIVHGDQDAVVPIASGEAMHAALSAADVETDMIVLEGASHGFTGADAEEALASSVRWFERHLGN